AEEVIGQLRLDAGGIFGRGHQTGRVVDSKISALEVHTRILRADPYPVSIAVGDAVLLGVGARVARATRPGGEGGVLGFEVAGVAVIFVIERDDVVIVGVSVGTSYHAARGNEAVLSHAEEDRGCFAVLRDLRRVDVREEPLRVGDRRICG